MRPGGSIATSDAGIAHRILRSPVGPVALALGLALASIPFVAASFMALWSGQWALWGPDAVALGWRDAFVLAVGSALTAALVAGSLGGIVVRRRPRLAALAAVGLSWPIGVAMLSITAGLTGMDLGIGKGWCETSCDVLITSEPASAIRQYASSVVLGGVTLLPEVVAIGALVLAYAARPGGREVLAVAVGAIAVAAAALQFVSLLDGGLVAFLCLAVGALVWTQLLVDPAVLLGADPGSAPRPDAASEGGLADAGGDA